MPVKKRVYIYPHTMETYRQGGNSYIKNLVAHLSAHYTVINKRTRLGLLDVFLKLPKCDVIYFNWIEDIPDRRLGFLQIPLLLLILVIAKCLNIKIIWFIHNNISHGKSHLFFKKLIVKLMKHFADLILSHSTGIRVKVPHQKFHVFHHPIEAYRPVVSNKPYQYDLLIWGTVSPYKGISEFIEFVKNSAAFGRYRIMIAGKFQSAPYYEYIMSRKPENVIVMDKMLPEEELQDLFVMSRFVLFTYNSPSVLSSAALCKTLAFGKESIGPNLGSFKELGNLGLLHNYDSFAGLQSLLSDIESGNIKPIERSRIEAYVQHTGWSDFANFLNGAIGNLYKKQTVEFT